MLLQSRVKVISNFSPVSSRSLLRRQEKTDYMTRADHPAVPIGKAAIRRKNDWTRTLTINAGDGNCRCETGLFRMLPPFLLSLRTGPMMSSHATNQQPA